MIVSIYISVYFNYELDKKLCKRYNYKVTKKVFNSQNDEWEKDEGGRKMNLSDSKKKLALAGVLCGLVAACLAYFGNPANMAFCIACFIRDTAGALGFHQAEVVQYARPEIIGLVIGAFIISVATKEYRSTAGSSPMIRFILGMVIMIGSLIFLGCPLRMVIRMSAGDLNAWVALIGFVLGVGTGAFALKNGFSLGRAHETNKESGAVLPVLMLGILILATCSTLLKASEEIKNVLRRRNP